MSICAWAASTGTVGATGAPRLAQILPLLDAAQAMVWLGLFLCLVLVRSRLERWLTVRFQRQRRGPRAIAGRVFGPGWMALVPQVPPGQVVVHAAAAVAALLAGATIPLAAPIRVGQMSLRLHLFGDTDAALLWMLALDWLSVGLLAFIDYRPGQPGSSASARNMVGILLANALPITLIVLALTVVGSAFQPWYGNNLSLRAVINLQGAWGGMRWLGIFQPFALLLWLICAIPARPGSRVQTSFAWQVHALNRSLLTGALFIGGWQGPFAAQVACLGPVYVLLKVGLVTILWTWVWASQAPSSFPTYTHSTWRVSVSLAAANLLVTAIVVNMMAK